MSVIPFGLIAQSVAILFSIKFKAIFYQILACRSDQVVVNDSLVMIDYINKKRLEGICIKEAIEESGVARLTHITRFFNHFLSRSRFYFETAFRQFFNPYGHIAQLWSLISSFL